MYVQIEDDDRGLLFLMVALLERIFSIECLTSEDVVLGLVSMDRMELLSSSPSSVSSDGTLTGAGGG